MPAPEPLIAGFVWLLGLCVGSFLNVVAYRLPRGLSIRRPAWSFCPRCEHTLAARDNIPLLGWFLIRGRCRYCGVAISAVYPVVEALTGLVFLLVFRLLFIEHARLGLDTASLPADAPLLLAWLTLAAALIACSVMDIASYTVDTRVTDFAMFAGIALHALWPRPDFYEQAAVTPGHPAYSCAALAGAVTLGMLWLTVWREPVDAPAGPDRAGAPPRTGHGGGGWLDVLGVFALVALGIFLIAGAGSRLDVFHPLLVAAFVTLFATMTLASGRPTEADAEVHELIEAEAPQARRMALLELAWLSPIIVGGLAGFLLVARSTVAQDYWTRLMTLAPLGDAWPAEPFAGAAYAVYGAMLAASAGWIVRIIFTLAFGREAFGVGDIYILAAAGAVAGWDIALLGALLSVGVAMLSWIIGLLLKRNVMIPFGPPLALGFLMALWWSRPVAARFEEPLRALAYARQERPELLLLLGGFLLVGGVAAVLLARLLRRVLEGSPAPPQDE